MSTKSGFVTVAPLHATFDGGTGAGKDSSPPRDGPRPVDPNSDTFAKRPPTTDSRLILPFEVDGDQCWTGGGGFPTDVRAEVPPQLAKAGVSTADWQVLMDALGRDVLPHSTSGLATCLSFTLLVTVAPVVWFGVRNNRYQRALGAWLDAANDRVFRPRGMLAKFQTYRADKISASWLAIALTRADAAALEAESIFWTMACCDMSHMVAYNCEPRTTCCCTPRVV